MAEILLVDDDRTYGEILQRFLHRHGHHVVWAKGVREASGLLEQGSAFDIILTDMAFPDGNVFDFLFSLKNDPTIPVLMLSGQAHWLVGYKARGCGICQCLQKGEVSMQNIEQTIRQELSQAAA